MTFARFQRPSFWSLHPVRHALALRRELDALFNQALTGAQNEPSTFENNGLLDGWLPAVDLYEANDAVIAKVELPGLKKEDINVSVEEGVLTLSGERKKDKEVLARFHRAISLPVKVDADKVTASYTNGVLTVTLAKSEEAKPKQINVN